jgi:hypothetical protein
MFSAAPHMRPAPLSSECHAAREVAYRVQRDMSASSTDEPVFQETEFVGEISINGETATCVVTP